jgi:polyphosphate glucokinase
MAEILGLDIGGTGIKAALVDLETGEFTKEKIKYATPQPSTLTSVAMVLNQLIEDFDWKGKVIGCGFPSIIKHNVIHSASNIDKSWLGVNLRDYFLEYVGNNGAYINDADAAGLAEVTYGDIVDKSGTTLMLTLGTGIGSGLFLDGKLVPNTELGHLTHKDSVWEKYASNGARKRLELDWDEWGARLNDYINHVDLLLNPDRVLLGGGVSKKHEKFLEYIELRDKVQIASMQNNAGIVGAALAALPLIQA